jgi:hypothetical protein
VEPIYIQAAQASMPQLKKVALAMGNRMAYADTYEQALAQLIEGLGGNANGLEPAGTPSAQPPQVEPGPAANVAPAVAPPSTQAITTLREIKNHLQRYRELSAQGKWAEAGKELDAIQGLVQK